jgi:hypothetical protein
MKTGGLGEVRIGKAEKIEAVEMEGEGNMISLMWSKVYYQCLTNLGIFHQPNENISIKYRMCM